MGMYDKFWFQLQALAIILNNRKTNSLNILSYLPQWITFCLRGKGWNHLWWLILCVNLTRLRDAQRPGKMLFLCVSMRVFLEGISIWISRLRKHHSHPCRWVVIQSIKGRNGTKRQRKGEFTLCLSWDIHLLLPSDIGAPGSSCQVEDHGTSQPPESQGPIPIINLLFYTSICLSFWFCFSGEPRLTHHPISCRFLHGQLGTQAATMQSSLTSEEGQQPRVQGIPDFGLSCFLF